MTTPYQLIRLNAPLPWRVVRHKTTWGIHAANGRAVLVMDRKPGMAETEALARLVLAAVSAKSIDETELTASLRSC